MIRWSVIRWGYVGPRLLALLLGLGLLDLAWQPFWSWVSVRSAEQLLRAEVELGGLETSPFSSTVVLHNVQAGNRGNLDRNLFRFERAELDVEPFPLFQRQLIFRECRIDGLEFDTLREEEARKVRGPRLPNLDLDLAALRSLGKEFRDLGISGLKKWEADLVASLRNPDLETIRLAEQLRTEWTTRLRLAEQRVRDLKDREQRIRAAIERPAADPLQKVAQIRQAALDLEQIRRELLALPREVETWPQLGIRDLERLKTARDQDLARLQQKLLHPVVQLDRLNEYLLSDELLGRLSDTLAWVEWVRYWTVDGEIDWSDPTRLAGEIVRFPRNNSDPDFLVRKLIFSGQCRWQGQPCPFRGTVLGLTNQPQKLAGPLHLEMQLEGPLPCQVAADFDRRGAEPKTTVVWQARWPVPARTWGNPEQLALRLDQSTADLEVRITSAGRQLTSTVQWKQEGVSLQPMLGENWGGEITAALLKDALAPIQNVSATLELEQGPAGHTLAVRSPLGATLAQSVTRGLEQRALHFQAEGLARFEQFVQQERAALSGFLAQVPTQLLAQVQLRDEEIRQLQALATRQLNPLDRLLR